MRCSNRKSRWIQEKHRKLYKVDRERLVQTLYVKSHHILGMEPFNFLENEERRHTVLVAGSEEEPFPVEKLSAKEVGTVHPCAEHVYGSISMIVAVDVKCACNFCNRSGVQRDDIHLK